MQSVLQVLCSVAVSAFVTNFGLADDVTIRVTIKAVDTDARTITVEHNGATRDFDLSRKATVTAAGKRVAASDLLPGDQASIVYHSDLQIVTGIVAAGKVSSGWQFIDVFKRGVTQDRAIIVSRDGRLACQPRVPGFCLASLQKFEAFILKAEIRYSSGDMSGTPFIAVCSTLPNPDGNGFKEQIPRGLELKLDPKLLGELILPFPEFGVELPLGQLRDGRRVVALRRAEIKSQDWNMLEITADEHKNVSFKINGTTVNAVAKVEKLKGHVIIFPQNAGIQIRNVTVIVDGKESPLSFDTIVGK